ncbi:MAG: PAS domain S-box protein [Dehalococcoidia bacterium]
MSTVNVSITPEIIDRWQGIVDLIADIVKVPAALIMKVEPPEITVFVASHSKGNPYKRGERASLETGLYCETVMRTCEQLLVPDALKDVAWKSNPDIKRGMISYFGFPVCWPNQEVFGTICVLDCKANTYNELYQRLILQFRDIIETDLRSLFDARQHLEEDRRIRDELQGIVEKQKQAVEELRESEGKYRSLIDQSQDVIYLLYEGKFELINQRFEELFGYTLKEANAPDFDFLNLVAPKSRSLVEERTRKVTRGETVPPRYEFTAISRDGTEIEVETSVSYINYKGGIAAQGILRDITERKRMQYEVEERREYLTAILRDTPGSIVTHDAGYHILEWNPGAEQLFGYAREEVLGKDIDDLVARPDVKEQAISFSKQVLSGEKLPPTEVIRYRKDGTPVDVIAAGSPIIIGHKIVGATALYTDITELKQAEAMIRREKSFSENIIATIPDSLLVLDKDLKIKSANRTFYETFQTRPERVIGSDISDILADEDGRLSAELTRLLGTDDMLENFELTYRSEKMGERIFNITARGMIVAEEEEEVIVIQDITERKRMQYRLRNGEST